MVRVWEPDVVTDLPAGECLLLRVHFLGWQVCDLMGCEEHASHVASRNKVAGEYPDVIATPCLLNPRCHACCLERIVEQPSVFGVVVVDVATSPDAPCLVLVVERWVHADEHV
ncbi:MAG: hypothetical protein EBZ16_04860, partial [Flavobacteriia bacterium]|nr:hypothetical protein [Flavobacteriia bacterium]